MIRKRISLLVTVAVRMILSMGTLAFIASQLAAAQFGIFATSFGLGTLIGLLSNLGFSIALVKDCAIDLPNTRAYTRAAFISKAVASLIGLAIISVYIIAFTEFSFSESAILGTLIVALVVASFGDLQFLLLRSMGSPKFELIAIVTQFLLQMTLLYVGAKLGFGMIFYILSVSITKLFYSVLATYVFQNYAPVGGSLKNISPLHYTKKSAKLAIESSIVNATIQVDGILISHFMGIANAGIYQSATRIVYGIIPFGSILNSIAIPKISMCIATQDTARLRRALTSTVLEYVGFGFVAAIAVYILGPIYSTHILGRGYLATLELWPILSLYVFFRFSASGFGAFLAVRHQGNGRTFTLLTVLLLVVGYISQTTPETRLVTVATIATCGAALQLISYIILTIVEFRRPL